MANKYEPLESRLQRNIQKSENGCWIWTGYRVPSGYGQLSVNGRLTRAHRASYAFYVGKIPSGLHVCHKCDSPSCVNPDHLFIGSHKDNMLDMTRKGRNKSKQFPIINAQGEEAGSSKLTYEQVEAIRAEYKRPSYGKSNVKQLAEKYGVNRTTILRAVTERTYSAELRQLANQYRENKEK